MKQRGGLGSTLILLLDGERGQCSAVGCYRLIRNVLYLHLKYKLWLYLGLACTCIYKYSLEQVDRMFCIFPLLKWLIFFNVVCLHS